MTSDADHIKWFRDSSPYIDSHRGSTMVVCLARGALGSDNLPNIISDLALMNSLGIRIVLVYGDDIPGTPDNAIISIEQMDEITAALGHVTADLSAWFSYSRPDFPVRRKDMLTVTGNFIKARPLGIIKGQDNLQSGAVRGINHQAVTHLLAGGAVVLMPAFGFSPSGEIFHLETMSVAREAACALSADKLIYLTADSGLFDLDGQLISEVDLSNFDASSVDQREATAGLLEHCDYACLHGVDRSHILSFAADGALLEELFTRDGCGTQIVGRSYEQIRPAVQDDVPGILKLIEPLEEKGVLVKRSRELLESEISRFFVIERDGLLISCAALYTFGDAGELACLVTHPDYRNGSRGKSLLTTIETAAVRAGLNRLFVLTTQSEHWFEERGFVMAAIDDLPAGKKDYYNYQRNSKVLIKAL